MTAALVGRMRAVVSHLGLIARAKAGPWRVECPVCGSRFREFARAGVASRHNALCLRCGALERHRLLWLFLRDRSDLFAGRTRVLHIAPEPCLARHISACSRIDYVRVDLDPTGVDAAVDLTRLPFAPDTFDVILCSHVLEHIQDDGAAMAAMFRVLRPGGWAVVQVPIDITRENTFEDPLVIDPAQRERVFNQSDHVRIYGRDYVARLESAGFHVHRDDFIRAIDDRLVTRYALVPEVIHVCRKSVMRQPTDARA